MSAEVQIAMLTNRMAELVSEQQRIMSINAQLQATVERMSASHAFIGPGAEAAHAARIQFETREVRFF